MGKLSRLFIVALVVCGSARLASAHPCCGDYGDDRYRVINPPPPPPHEEMPLPPPTPHEGRNEVGYDVSMGTIGLGIRAPFAGGLGFSYGRRYARLLLRGEYQADNIDYDTYPDATDVTVTQRHEGFMHRVDATARWSFKSWRWSQKKFGFDLWVEGGLGREWLHWDRGGTIDRNFGVVGFGADEVIRFASHESKAHTLRGYIAVRFFRGADATFGGVGDAGGTTVAARCTTACANTTTTTMGAGSGGHDTGVQLSVGFTWGF